MALDAVANFILCTVVTAPSPADSGTTLVLTAGQGATLPTPPFNMVVKPPGVEATAANAEVVRVTNVATDTVTIARQQEGSAARVILAGDDIRLALTAKMITDLATGTVYASRQIISGAGLTGGGDLSADRTLAVGAGYGITVNADDVALASTTAGAGLTYTAGVLAVVAADTSITVNADSIQVALAATSGLQVSSGLMLADSIAGAGLTITGKVLAVVAADTSITINADSIQLPTPGTITVSTTNAAAAPHLHTLDLSGRILTAGAGLTGGGMLSSDLTFDVGAGIGITVNADDVAVNEAYNFAWTGDHSWTRQLSSDSFASGWTGNGWRVDNNLSEASRATAEFDTLTVRGRMRVYELLINQIRATNGSVFISSTGKVKNITSGSTPGGITFEDSVSLTYEDGTLATFEDLYTFESDDVHGFLVGDLIRAERFSGSQGLYQSDLLVTSVTDTTHFVAALRTGSDAPAVGYEYVRLGSASDTNRQGSVYLTADDSNAPYIDIVDGVSAHALWNTSGVIKARLGKLTGITDPEFGALSGYGLWTANGYFTGKVAATAGFFGTGNNVVSIENGGLAIGSYGAIRGGQSAYNIGTGFWMGYSGGTYKFSIGNPAGDYLYFDGTNLVLNGSATLVGSLPWSDITNDGHKPADDATVGATWGTNLNSIPATLGTPSGTGLFLSATHMGFYTASTWKTYIDNAGNLILGDIAGGNTGLSWNQGTGVLEIRGVVNIVAGGNAATASYADGVASAAQAAAISTAAGDATTKANTAQSTAISTAAGDATTKADTAQSTAISTAAGDATTKANAAQSTAISTAAGDATTKANTAQSNAISTAAGDATSKANAAQGAAQSYADGLIPATIKAPSGTGLFLSATHMGFYTASTWKTYIDNAGNMVLGDIAGGNTGLSWNQGTGVLTINGVITAIAGALGGWVLGATSIKDAAGVVGMSSAVTGGDDIRFWAGHATPASAPFRVTEAGVLTASSGLIGGFTITATELYSGTGATRVELQAAGGIWAGADAIGSAPFSVTPAGALVATNATITGAITITSGSVPNAVVAGLGALALKGSVDLSTAEVTNKSLANVDSTANTKLGGIAAGADVTSANTAAAIAGQGALATKSTADFSTDVSGATKPANNATVGATWGTNLNGIPATLGTPSGTGLFLSATHMGYYTASTWKTYIDDSGNFRFAYDANNYLQFTAASNKLQGIGGGVEQWYASAVDGKIYAGAGKVVLDEDGIQILAGALSPNKIRWVDAMPSTLEGGILETRIEGASPNRYAIVSLLANFEGSGWANSQINLQAATINLYGDLTWSSDDTYDIGASGANRPKDIFASGGLNVGSATGAGTGDVNISGSYKVNGAAFAAMPVGAILPYAGASAPTGFLICDGAAVSRTTYAALFTAISTAYGAGDGSTTFNVPDLRGRAPIGKGAHVDVNTLNDNDGLADASRTPKHEHDQKTTTANTESSQISVTVASANGAAFYGLNVGGGLSVKTIPLSGVIASSGGYVVVNYIIKF